MDAKVAETSAFASIVPVASYKEFRDGFLLQHLRDGSELANGRKERREERRKDNGWRGSREMAGGAFTNQAVHYIDTMQWLSIGLVVVSGIATMLTSDPRFVMAKPTVIYCIVGLVMLKRGWMNRYLPERAAPVADVATAFGFVWAGLMFGSAALNIALALSLDVKSWAAAMSAWGLFSKIGLFLIQYGWMTMIGRRRAAAAGMAPT